MVGRSMLRVETTSCLFLSTPPVFVTTIECGLEFLFFFFFGGVVCSIQEPLFAFLLSLYTHSSYSMHRSATHAKKGADDFGDRSARPVINVKQDAVMSTRVRHHKRSKPDFTTRKTDPTTPGLHNNNKNPIPQHNTTKRRR